MSKNRVVIDRHFGVGGDETAVGGFDERVNFDLAGVFG